MLGLALPAAPGERDPDTKKGEKGRVCTLLNGQESWPDAARLLPPPDTSEGSIWQQLARLLRVGLCHIPPVGVAQHPGLRGKFCFLGLDPPNDSAARIKPDKADLLQHQIGLIGRCRIDHHLPILRALAQP